jgi:hypothetical protein
MTSADALHKAQYNVLVGDSALLATLGVGVGKPQAVFNGMAPRTAQLPYIVIGSATEGAFPSFAGSGNQGVDTLHIWSNQMGDQEVLAIYAHIDRLLNAKLLTVTGLQPVFGKTSILFVLPESRGSTTVMHGLIQYESLRFAS